MKLSEIKQLKAGSVISFTNANGDTTTGEVYNVGLADEIFSDFGIIWKDMGHATHCVDNLCRDEFALKRV